MGRPSKSKRRKEKTLSNCHTTKRFSIQHVNQLSTDSGARKGILDRLPDYLRDTVDWFIGHHHHLFPDEWSTILGMSNDVDNPNANRGRSLRSMFDDWKQLFDSCSFMRRKSRSRSRKSKERTNTTSAVSDRMQKRVASASYAVRPPPKSPDLICVCDSIDEQMVAKITELPNGIERREWIAHNVLGIFEHVNSLCGTVTEICTPVTCPHMSFPGTSKASYQDDRGKRHYYPAMQYIDCVITQCETVSRQEDVFPTKYGNNFGDNFEPSVKKILRYLWHCMGHLYIKHWDEIGLLQLRPQCAIVFAHISELGKAYNLMDPKDQYNIDSTVIMVRPVLQITPLTTTNDEGRDKKSDELNKGVRVPSSKSGSWGGYPSPAVLTCKPYAQTC